MYREFLEGRAAGKKLSLRTFNQHISRGVQYAMLAGAGSFYFLVLVTACKMRKALAKIVEDELGTLCAHIRDPRPGKF